MKKFLIPVVTGLLFGMLIACTGLTSSASEPGGTMEAAAMVPESTPSILSDTPSPSVTPTPSATVTLVPPTLTPTPSVTPTPDPDAWQSLPFVPTVNANTRRIYENGQKLGNDPHAFSILGDCLSLPRNPNNLFVNYGKGPGHYNLGEYTSLQPVIDWFVDSFKRQSISLGNGFNTAAVLSPAFADAKQCQKNESPMVCEYRVHHPSYAIISLGTDDYLFSPETYEKRMREIVEYTISQGIVPILATKADNREGDNAFNRIVARLAYEFDVPLWNFWAAVQSLPNRGLSDNLGHLTWADPNHFDYTYSMRVAIPVRNLTALQTLDSLWRGLIGP